MSGGAAGPARRGMARAIASAVLYFAANIGAKLIGFLYFLLLARWLGVADFGLITYAAAIAVLADTAADLGMGRLVLREAAQDPARAPAITGLLVPVKLCIGLALFALVVALLPARYHEGQVLLIFAVYAVWVASSGVAILLEQVLHARGAFAIASLARVLPGLVQLLAGWAAHLVDGSAPVFAASAALGGLSYLAVILAALRRFGAGPALSFSAVSAGRALLAALPFALVSTLLLMSLRVEFFVLGQVADAEALGVFGMAGRFYEAGLVAPIAFATVMTPRIVRAFPQGAAALEAVLAPSLRVAGTGAVAAAFAGAPLVRPVVELLLPAAYGASADYLLLMLAGFPFHAVHILNVSAMLALPRQRRPALLMAGLVALQAAVAVAGAVSAGAMGAAVALAVSALLSCAASSAAAALWLGRPAVVPRALAPALAGGLAGLAALQAAGPAAALLAAAGVMAAAALLLPLGPART